MKLLLLRLAGLAAIVLGIAPAAAYDDDVAACATCHSEIAASYAQTGMGRSFSRLAPAKTVEDSTNPREFYHPLSDTHYSMIRRGGASFQRRWQAGFGGKETNVEELKIDYVIGSGNHSRSYLHRTARGTLIELPLSWYSEEGGGWGMSPGFDSPHPATRRLASYECIFCHNAYPRIPAGHDEPGAEPVFTGELPQGIDCQRCHGPGEKHVRAAQTAGSKPEEIRAAIVNPARLSAKLRMDLCLQCHLEPTSAEIPSLIRRFDRGPFSFRPGEPFESFLLAFDHAPGTGHDEKFEIVNSSAYRLRQSRCFLESKGALTCDTCHDPHRAPRGPQAAQRYSAACRQCHAAALDALTSRNAHPSGADCAGCHMPRRRTEDVVHVVMTDHRIVRRPKAGNLLAELSERHAAQSEQYRGEVVPYYPAAASALYRAVAQIAMGNNVQKGVAELARELKTNPAREAAWQLTLGDGWQALVKPVDAAAAYERALRLKPDSVRGMLSLAAAWKAAGQPARAAEVLQRAIPIAGSDARPWRQAGALAAESGQIEDAIGKLRKAIELDPDLPGGYTSLGEILERVNQNDRAAEALQEALRIDPYDAAAWDYSGRALAGKGQLAEAIYNFERAIRYRPDFAPHLYDYALALTSANRFDDAQAQTEAAVRADPKMAEARVLLGGLLARKRQWPDATREYREAVRLRPDFARARLDLATALAAQGDMAGAAEHLREAAKGNDPAVARVAAQALERLGRR